MFDKQSNNQNKMFCQCKHEKPHSNNSALSRQKGIINQSVSSQKSVIKKGFNKLINLQQRIQLPSNLLQQPQSLLQQFRSYHSYTPKQQIHFMSKTFSTQKPKNNLIYDMVMENNINKIKEKGKSHPLYRRLSNIQKDHQELDGVSFSKLLSRMKVIDSQQTPDRRNYQHRSRKYANIQSKLRSIPNYQCLQSKLFTIQCPQITYQVKSPKKLISAPVRSAQTNTTRLFRRYFNPNNQNQLSKSYQTVQFDDRYIYINGKKTKCKRIHNFYTSQAFQKGYQKAMRNTVDGFTGYKTTREI